MKVFYLTVPSYFDLEISLIRELSKVCDVTVMMIVSPPSMHSSAFSVDGLLPECAIVESKDYPGMTRYDHLIDRSKWLIANNPDNSFQSCWTLSRMIIHFIKELDCDIIHSTTACKTSLFLLPFFRSRRYTLYTLHDPIPHNKLRWYSRLIYQDLVFRSYKNLLLLSDSMDQEFRSRNRGKYRNIYYSSLSVYDYLTSYPPSINYYGDYVLFFGRIDQYKGVDLLMKAFPQTQAYKNGVNLVVAGNLKYGLDLNNNDRQITVLSRYISNEELSTLIYHCKFVVLPYRSATQSGCVFSAFAFGKPVLATSVGDLSKQVDESTGLLIRPNSVEAIVKGIDKMVSDGLDEKSDCIKSRYSGEGDKSWNSIAHGLLNVYETIKQ